MRFRRVAIVVGALLLVPLGMGMNAGDLAGGARGEIDAFNKKFVELHLKMDTPGIMAMWAEDGVDLMQGRLIWWAERPSRRGLKNVLAKTPGYKVTKEEMAFHDIQVCGDGATEWATEHQVAQAPEANPNLDGYGKMALVLHREASGGWKIQQEVWNASPKP